MSSDAREVEQFRAECEAREWLKRGYTTSAKVRILRTQIAKHRGEKAADALVEEMRRQWPSVKNKCK